MERDAHFGTGATSSHARSRRCSTTTPRGMMRLSRHPRTPARGAGPRLHRADGGRRHDLREVDGSLHDPDMSGADRRPPALREAGRRLAEPRIQVRDAQAGVPLERRGVPRSRGYLTKAETSDGPTLRQAFQEGLPRTATTNRRNERPLERLPAGIKPPRRHCQAITVSVHTVSVQPPHLQTMPS